MITTYYLYTEEGLPRYKIHLVSVICANKNNKPVPNYKVITPRRIEQADHSTKVEPKQVFSNFMVENGAITRFNSCKYEETTSSLTNIKDSRWIPYKANVDVKNEFYRYSYMTTPVLSSTHDSSLDSLFQFLNSEARNVEPDRLNWFSPYVVVKEGDPTLGEWPSPVVIRVDDGTIVKFYEPDDTSFSNAIYWQDKSNNISGLNVIFVYNLVPNKTYNYKVFREEENESLTLKTGIYGKNNNYGTIRTEGQIRMIKFKGVRNARDVGGWPTLDGGTFKYGLIFRGSQLDEANGRYNVSKAAIKQESDRKEFFKLNIEQELDLRATSDKDQDNTLFGAINSSTYIGTSKMIRIKDSGKSESSGIRYYRWGDGATPSYQGWYDNKNQFIGYLNTITLKASLGKASYVHCVEGKDRTGTFILLLEALCNVKSDALIKDYELSNMWTSNTYNRFTLQQGNLGKRESVGSSKAKSTFQTFNVTNKDITLQQGIKDWFTKEYNKCTQKVKRWNSSGTSGTNITDAEKAIDYIVEVFIEKKKNSNTEVTLLGGSRILNKATIYNASGDAASELISPLRNGAKALVSGTSITINNILAFGDSVSTFNCNGTQTNVTLIQNNKILIYPNTESNLISGYYSGKKWTETAFTVTGDGEDYTRYYLKRVNTANYYAMCPFYVLEGKALKLKFPTKTGSVKIEFMETGTGGCGADLRPSQGDAHIKGYGTPTTITLNSNHEGTYIPTQSGFMFINLSTSAPTGYTSFTEDEIKNVRVTNVNYKVPSLYCEKLTSDSTDGLSLVYYNNYAINFKSSISSIKVINVNTKATVTFSSVSGVVDGRNHALAASLLPVKYNSSDYFPMILVSGYKGVARVLRISGTPVSSGTSITGLSVEKVHDWYYPYVLNSKGEKVYWSGDIQCSVDFDSNTYELYYLKYSSVVYRLKKTALDIGNINYSAKQNIQLKESDFEEINTRCRVSSLDVCMIHLGNEDILAMLYGWLSGTDPNHLYCTDNNLLGVVFFKINPSNSTINLIGFLDVTQLLYEINNKVINTSNNIELDGIAWGEDTNTLYLMSNHPHVLYKIVLSPLL